MRVSLVSIFTLLACLISSLSTCGQNGAAHTNPAALAEGRSSVVIGTTSPGAVHAGLEMLKRGGTAADAAVATALAQVVECGGCYVSAAGIYGMIYYDAGTGKTHYLNACYNTVQDETDPASIPSGGNPSGRSALVPGFMAGIQATHDRFGKLPRKVVFAPAINMASDGIKVSPLLDRFIATRSKVLSRLPETKRLFIKKDGKYYAEGELFRQPELATTLRAVGDQGAAYMYTGPWAEKFVAAVQREGGKITMKDLRAYQPSWEEPVRTMHRGHEVCAGGLSSLGGVNIIEALHLLDEADLPRRGNYATSPQSLFWLMQISHCQVLGFIAPAMLKDFQGLDLLPESRLRKQTASAIWKKMNDGNWPFAASLKKDGETPSHSDGVVVADRWGNVAAVTHSINTVLWGDTGIFVDGVSIPDSAAIQRDAVGRAGPGKRLPDPMCPLIVLKDGKPVLGSSAIGGGLHQRTLQMLASVLDFQMDPQAAVEAPTLMLPDYSGGKPVAQVDQNQYEPKQLAAVRALGQPVKELAPELAGGVRGYWVGVHIDPNTGLRRAIGTRRPPIPSVAVGY